VGRRTARKEQTSIAGNVQTATLSCPAIGSMQVLIAAEDELKQSGFQILFSDREHAANGWITGRAGKRWVELVSAPDGESISYALTVVPSAEVLTGTLPEPKIEPGSVPVAAPKPEPAPQPEPPKPVQTAAVQMAAPVTPVPTPAIETPVVPAPIQPPPGVGTTPPKGSGFIPPRPILEVPIEPTHDRIYSVTGDVVISLLVDVGVDGSVTNAALTGRITKDVLKLESAALDAVSHWRFEPARQDERVVPAVRISVTMHFRGRPWRY
jgi:TonB family protein